jgi:hypothetical protein
MFSKINTTGWMKGIFSVVVACAVLAGMSSQTYAQLPDLTITRSELQFPTLYGFVSNIGDATPGTSVVVGAWVSIYNCYTGQTKTLSGTKKYRGSFFTPGNGGWVNFRISLRRGWIITKTTLFVDPFNQVYEYTGDNNGIETFINSSCYASGASKIVPAAKQGKNAIQFDSAELTKNQQNGNARIEILTLNGQKVYTQTTSNAGLTAEELSRVLPNGVYLYILTIQGANGEIVKREVRKLSLVK